MAKCPFCRDDVKEWDLKREGYLIGTHDVQDHTHIHATFDKPKVIKEIIKTAIEMAELQDEFSGKQAGKELPKEVVFRNKQRIGDSLMMTCAVRDFKKAFPQVRVNAISTAMHIWDNNPNVDFDLVPTEANTVFIGPKDLTNASNRLDWHFCNAYRVSIEKTLGISFDQGPTKPDIWITEEEYNAPPVTTNPYWIISIGGEKGWGCKMYPFEKWQAFVEQNPEVLFYQIGAREDRHPVLQGKNVVDYIGKTQDKETGIRDLFKLFLNMEGGIGLVSFGMHLASAFNKPYVVIAGAREPRSFTAYPGHQYLSTENTMACARTACWHCDIDTCTSLIMDSSKSIEHDRKVPRCVDIIKPEDITHAMKKYYDGFLLTLTSQSKKPDRKSLNIAKEAKVSKPLSHTVLTITDPAIKQCEENTELKLNPGSLTEKDWIFIKSVIQSYGIKSVLEFGTGISTLLLKGIGVQVVSYETMESWIAKVKAADSSLDIRYWNGHEIKEALPKFDFAFMDGPSGAQNREWSTKYASEHADIVIIHDASRMHERTWQTRYLKDKFELSARGGNRCHLWIKRGIRNQELEKFECFSVPKQENLDIIQDYIANGVLQNIQDVQLNKGDEKCIKIEKVVEVKEEERKESRCQLSSIDKKSIKFVFNGRGEGGAERSATWMLNMLHEMGHEISYITPNDQPCGTFRKDGNKEIHIGGLDELQEACDILVLYSNDWVWEFNSSKVKNAFEGVNASRKVLCVNYKLGKIGLIDWTMDWDLYMFLNSKLEAELLKNLPGAHTIVMAPPTVLSAEIGLRRIEFPDLRLVRHSSQGDSKYPKDFNEIVDKILTVRKDCSLRLMPAPSFLKDFGARVNSHKRNVPPVIEFLQYGNCFWYYTPEGYTEGGPKVVMEAQASGIPVIANNSSGMKDRVVPGTGWLCDTVEDHINVIKSIEVSKLKEMGENAREHARAVYDPMLWIKHILGEI